MSLSTQDVNIIANIIENSRRGYGGQDVLDTRAVLNELVEYLGSENWNFDAEVFLACCGGSVGDRHMDVLEEEAHQMVGGDTPLG
tara:strand:+ start:376 stop:630 length:255 start_codon:yes stop_codon:yes gene_type:complete